jgi:hypothetical protein
MRTANKEKTAASNFSLAVALCLAVVICALRTPSVMAADVDGTVTSRRGIPLEKVKVLIRDRSGKIVKAAYTDKYGRYKATGLDPGVYHYTCEGGPIGFTGGTETIANLPREGLTINWAMTSGGALATAYDATAGFQADAGSGTNTLSNLDNPAGGANVGGSNIPIGSMVIPTKNKNNNNGGSPSK